MSHSMLDAQRYRIGVNHKQLPVSLESPVARKRSNPQHPLRSTLLSIPLPTSYVTEQCHLITKENVRTSSPPKIRCSLRFDRTMTTTIRSGLVGL